MDKDETKVLVISSSLAAKSRSRIMAQVALESLRKLNMVEPRWIDLAEFDLLPYPRSENDPALNWMREEFEAADGFVLSCPIYNWGAAASLTNFLHYVLDSDGGRRYRPFITLAGAGTVRSHLAVDGVARSILNEIRGIQVGPPILGAGSEVDRESATVDRALTERIDEVIEVLVVHSMVYAQRFAKSMA
jgi:NAD(P)H-dependent FMN reductase